METVDDGGTTAQIPTENPMPRQTDLLRLPHVPLAATRTAICLAACLVTSSAAADVSSTFDTNADGWTAQGDTATPVQWIANGGNPAGHIQVVDSVSGGVIFFVAPAKFLGDKSQAYGRSLHFDLRQVYSGAANQFVDRDVILTGGGITIAFDTPVNPPVGAWGSYTVPLSAGGWRLNSLSGAVATDTQIQTVLGALSSLQIRCEYQTGADTGSLDNVVLETCSGPDLDGDGSVSAADLSLLLVNWGGGTIGDIDCDGSVGASDLSLLLAAWD